MSLLLLTFVALKGLVIAPVELMAMASSEFITLRGGLVLPASAIIGALDLEARGFTMRAEPDGRLVTSPGSRLTDVDRRFLAEHKAALLAIVSYDADLHGKPQ